MIKRLIKKAFNYGSTVRFLNNPNEKSILTVIKINDDGTYNLTNQVSNYNDVNETDITDSKNFIVGDQVNFKNHPYDNKIIFTVEEILPNGNYFINSDGNSYTDINGVNLKLAP